jgi:hypothetical protein
LLTHQTAVVWNVLSSGVTQTHGYPVPVLTQLVGQQSAMIAYDYLFRLTAIVFVLSMPLVLFINVKKGSAPSPMAMAAE